MNRKALILLAPLSLLLAFFGAWLLLRTPSRMMPTQNPPIMPDPSQASDMTLTTETIDTTTWKTYRNEEIGIEFKYPSSWGSILVTKEQACLDFDEVTRKKLLEGEGDPCLHISLSAEEGGKFLATESLLNTEHGVPRGADWSYRMVPLKKTDEDFCQRNSYIPGGVNIDNCKIITNKNGITIVRGKMTIPFTGNEKMTAYFMHTSHPIYKVITISAVEMVFQGNLQAESDMEQLVESIQFLENS